MSDANFAQGMRVYKPSDRAPEFIIANLDFRADEFAAYLEAHAKPDGSVRVVIKESRGGKYYAQLDQYTAKNDDTQHRTHEEEAPSDNLDPSDVPF